MDFIGKLVIITKKRIHKKGLNSFNFCFFLFCPFKGPQLLRGIREIGNWVVKVGKEEMTKGGKNRNPKNFFSGPDPLREQQLNLSVSGGFFVT